MTEQLFVFTIDNQQFAVLLSAVEKIVRAVETTPLPKAPEIISGVINVSGRIVPVVNMRKRFRIPEKEVDINDKLVIAQTLKTHVAFFVDEAVGVIEAAYRNVVEAEEISPGIEYVEGVMTTEEGLILIHDLDQFLSLEEETGLDRAMKENGSTN